MAWFSAGAQVNPVTDAILADTGAIASAGSGRLVVMLGASVATIAIVERRNAANSANISSQVIACAANELRDIEFPGMIWDANERFRVRINPGITGTAQASVFTF